MVGASIYAEADDTFAADNNATELVFATGASEAAAEKMRLTSDGKLGIGIATPASSLDIRGTVQVGVDDTGHDVKFFGATSGSFMLWNESEDRLQLTDSTPLSIGDGNDMNISHDGTNSLIAVGGGSLRVAAETSGIPITIGHTTSETTIGDNLTVTGALSVTDGVIFNDAGAAVDFRVESDNNANMFFLDASADAVGINNGAPYALLTVGSGTAGQKIGIAGSASDFYGFGYGTSRARLQFFGGGTTEMMSITDQGRVGIGTAAPDTKLHIQGTGQQIITVESDDHNAILTLDWDGTDEGIILFKEGGTEKGRIWMDGTAEGMRFKTAGTERLTILADGKVGIGTTAPANRFHVEETTDADLVVKLVGYEARAAILELWADQGDEDADKQRIKSSNDSLTFDSYGSGSWVSNMTILWGGNVGIGTTAPDGSLHVHSASAGSVTAVASADELVVEGSAHTGISILSGASHSATLAFGDAGDNDIGQVGYDHGSNSLFFIANAVQRMTISSAGYVGIGNTNPGDFDGANAQRLVVGDGTGHDGMTIFSSGTDSGTIAFGDSASGAAAYAGRISYAHNTNALSFYTGGNTFAMTIDSSQKVGIGIDAPKQLLDVSGAGTTIMHLGVYSTTDGHQPIFRFQKSGNATVGTYGATADDEVLGALVFHGVDSSSATKAGAAIYGTQDAAADSDSVLGRLTFHTSDADDAGSPTERMRIDSTGKVDIVSSIANNWLSKINNTNSTAGSGLLVRAGNASTNTALQVDNHNGSINFLKVQGDGNVGIGDTDPSEAKLSVFNDTAGDYGIKIEQEANNDALYINNEGTASGINVYNTGSIGRGLYVYSNADSAQNQPLVDFHADYSSGSSSFDKAVLRVTNDGKSYGIQIDNNDPGGFEGDAALRIDQNAPGPGIFVNQDGNASGIHIDQDGNGVALYIVADGSNYGMYLEQNDNHDGIFVNQDGDGSGLYVDMDGTDYGVHVHTTSTYAGYFVEQTANGDAIRIHATGGGVGLKIDQDGNGDGILIVNDGNESCINLDHNGQNTALYINSSSTSKGSIGVSDGAEGYPAYSFHGDYDTGMYRISGDTLGFSIGGSKRWTMASDGNWFPNSNYHVGTSSKPIGTLYYTSGTLGSSDKTLKDNIQECDLGTDFINKLKPISFNWKESVGVNIDTTLTNYGLVAQDVLDTELKDSIDGDKEGEYKMNYNHLFAPMIKAIQELSSKNKALEAEVTALKNA